MLPATCQIAFKEWAVICESLATGSQTLILRKGGIDEGPDGFRVEHPQFWLFPTYLHQADRHKLSPAAWPSLDRLEREHAADAPIRLELLADVQEVISLREESLVGRLAGLHWWSDETARERFHYRRPGLFLLVVRIYKLPNPVELAQSPYFAGCRSWVELPQPLPTPPLAPVLADDAFLTARAAIYTALGQPTA